MTDHAFGEVRHAASGRHGYYRECAVCGARLTAVVPAPLNRPTEALRFVEGDGVPLNDCDEELARSIMGS